MAMKLNDGTPMQTHITGGEENDPNITEGQKKFIFSSTGNIMVATTEKTSDNLDSNVRDVFNEVSVFFAAMTKAISTTKRPNSDDNYTLYDYAALEKVIDGSGCFIHCTQEDIDYKSTSFGVEFSRELITSLLGLPVAGGTLSFAQAMISSIGQEALKLSSEKDTSDSRVGNIVFVCEYLFGMPIISATVVYIDSKSESKTINAGPCVKTSSTSVEMNLHKDVYMFVTPSFINKYASDLDSIIDSKEYNRFVVYLKSLLTTDIIFDGLFISNNDEKVEDGKLTVGTEYYINGSNFGNTPGTLSIGGKGISCSNWENENITFTPQDTCDEQPLVITTSDKKTLSIGDYNIAPANSVKKGGSDTK